MAGQQLGGGGASGRNHWQSKGVTANYSLLLSNGSISKRFKENGLPMEQLYNRFAKREAPETR